MQSRYYNPTIGRFINADALVSTGQGMLGNNMFSYCNNSPVINMDHTGHRLQFCHQGAVPVPFGDLIYETDTNSIGKLYEYWLDPATGKKVWSRHHTDHGNPKKHTDPHDHEWKDDEDGHNKPGPPQPPNPNYTAPSSNSNQKNNSMQAIGDVAAVAFVAVIAYVGVKWIVAAVAAPITGGGSLVVVALMP